MRHARGVSSSVYIVLLAGCTAGVDPDAPVDRSGRSDVAAQGKADGIDVCAQHGWYDDPDGYCDEGYCAMPDPDCGPDPDGCGDTADSEGLVWNGSPESGCRASDVGDGLRERTLAAYETSIRARKFIHRLLEGHSADLVREVIDEELELIADNIAALERTNYERSAQRRAYMERIKATRDELHAFLDLLDELEATDGWQAWFPPSEICHNLEVTEVDVALEVRGFVEASLAPDDWAATSVAQRTEMVEQAVSEARHRFPDAGEELRRLVELGAAGQIAQAEDVELARARLAFLLQVGITGTITRMSCPGDDRIEESNVHYSGSRYYNYGAILDKDIWIVRSDSGYVRHDDLGERSERYQSAVYRFSFQGIERAGSVLAGPVDRSERILAIQEDGRIHKGEAYARYFTDYGAEIPDRVPADKTESLIRAVDAYLAGYLEVVQLDLHIRVALDVAVVRD